MQTVQPPREGTTTGTATAAPRRDARVAVALSAALLSIYSLIPATFLGNDTRPAAFTAVSLAKRGDFDLDEFAWAFKGARPDWPYNVLPAADGHVVSRLGVGGPVAALPVFAPVLVAKPRISESFAMALGRFVAALYTAAAAGFVFATARRMGAAMGGAVLVAATYGLGTCAFSVASQALWQHGPAQFFLALGTWLLVRDDRWAPLAGAAFGAAVLCRPPDAFFALAAVAFAVWRWRRVPRRLAAFVGAAAPMAAAQLAYNARYLGSPFTFGQTVQVTGADALPHASYWQNDYAEGVLGLLVSPSRGLLVYTPVFGFLVLYLWRGAAWRRLTPAVKFQLAGALALLLVMARYYGWYGGWCFGYRMLADAAPALCLALVPLLETLGRLQRLLFAASVAASLTIHLAGAANYSPFDWDMHPDLDRHTDRLWSVADGQLRYVFTRRRSRVPL